MRRNIFLNAVIFVALVFIDQLSKYLIRLQGGFYICNEGIAFGINVPPFAIWIIIAILAVFIISPLVKGGLGGIFKVRNFLIHNSLFLILILSGGVSNIIDRLVHGCVIDFIDIKIWPVFNLADIFITLGALLLVYFYLRKEK